MTAAASVPVARDSARLGKIRLILLATDLSTASDAATALAFDLAFDLGARLLILSAIDQAALQLRGPRPRRIDQVRVDREAVAQQLVERGRLRGIAVEFLVWEGQPGEVIVDAALSERVDLLVVGSHGRGSVERLLIGSVSEHVVRHAPCPVLVVRGATG